MPRDTMVLRSLHLPVKLDDHLRALAFQLRCNKSELIRFFAAEGLHQVYTRHRDKFTSEDASRLLRAVQFGEEMVEQLPEAFPLVLEQQHAERRGQY